MNGNQELVGSLCSITSTQDSTEDNNKKAEENLASKVKV